MIRHIAVSTGIVALLLAYLLFTYQQLFSPFAMAGILMLPIISLVIFIFAEKFESKPIYLVLGIIAIALITFPTIFYIHPGPGTYMNLSRVFILVSIATAISIFFIYLSGKVVSKHIGVLAAILLIIIGSALAYISMYGFSNIEWNGVDELAANYYAASLALHGVNPYATSMQTIYNERHVFPTVLLNGSYEDFYAYPAMSFIAYMPIVALGIGSHSFMPFIAILIFFVMSASAMVYAHSGRCIGLLIPLALWLFGCYTLAGVSNAFLVTIFVVLAYIYMRKSFASGILLGLAASVSQLAWFALPFFYILTYNSKGKLHMQVLGTFVSFLAINIYFFAASPGAFISSVLGIMGMHALVFFGQNIANFFYAFYPVSQLYISALSITVLLFSMLVYYLYPRSARLLIALAPIFIFFLSWRNISIYGLAYVPLLLAVYYGKECNEEARDRIKRKIYIAYGLIAIIFVFSILAVYLHDIYTANRIIAINRIYPVIGVGSYGYSLEGFVANVTNNAKHNETVTFYMISRSPNEEAYMLGTLLPQIGADSTMNYSVNFALPLVNSNTKIIVFAFSSDYVASNVITLSNLP